MIIFPGLIGILATYRGATPLVTGTLYNPNRYVYMLASSVTGTDGGGISETTPTGIFLHPSGTTAYIIGGTSNQVKAITLGTAWEADTRTSMTSTAKLKTTASVDLTDVGSLFMSPDGTYLFTTDQVIDGILRYTLSTPWDITTLNVTASQQLLTPSYLNPRAVTFNPSGTLMTVTNLSAPTGIRTYTLSTAWDLSTAVLTGSGLVSPSADLTNIREAHYVDNGNKLVISYLNSTNQASTITIRNTVVPYSCNSTTRAGMYVANVDLTDHASDASYQGFYFRNDGQYYYIIDSNLDAILEYRYIGGSPVTWKPTSYTTFNATVITSLEATPTAIDFKTDGTRVFYAGASGDRIRSWNLPNAWNLSGATTFITSSLLYDTSATTQLGSTAGFEFAPDGASVFVVDSVYSTNGGLFKFTLSTPWDVSTINPTASQQTTVITSSGGENSFTPNGIRFNADGTKFFIVNGSTPSRIRQWTLSTAYDLTSSITYVTGSGGAAFSGLNGLSFADSGSKLYAVVAGTTGTGDALYYWELSSSYDISSVTSTNWISARNMSFFDNNPTDVYMKNDGSNLYYVGSGNDVINNLTLDK